MTQHIFGTPLCVLHTYHTALSTVWNRSGGLPLWMSLWDAIKYTEMLLLQQHDGRSVWPHLPYSPGVALYDFWLFPKVKRAIKGKCFELQCLNSEHWVSQQSTTKDTHERWLPELLPKVKDGISGFEQRGSTLAGY